MSNNEEKKNPKNKITSRKATPTRELNIVEKANIDWINASSMSEKNKKKALAFMNCDPKDIHLYIDNIPGAPKKDKSKSG